MGRPPLKKNTKKPTAPDLKEALRKPRTKTEADKEATAYIESLRKSGQLGDVNKKIDLISTGSWVVNHLIGDGTLKDKAGGIPRGYITEIFGDEGTGKTTLALSIAKQALDAGDTIIYADFEQSLRTQFQYIRNMGIDPTPPKFVHLIPTNLQDGAKTIAECMVKLNPSLIIVDSVTSMLPKEAFDNDADEVIALGQQARLVGSFLNWFNKRLAKRNVALILLNQLRNTIKQKYDTGPREVTSGGRAVPYFSTIRIHLKGTSDREEVTSSNLVTGLSEKKYVNQSVKVVIEKNKLDMPWKSGPIYIEFGQGIDNVLSLIALGINRGVIKAKAAGYLNWQDPNSDASFNIQGKMNVKKYLESNPDVFSKLQPYLIPTTDTKEMDDIQIQLETKGVDNLTPEEKDQLKDIRKIKGLPTDDLEFTAEEAEDLKSLEKDMGMEC